MRNIGKYADNVMNVMREIAHIIKNEYGFFWIPAHSVSFSKF